MLVRAYLDTNLYISYLLNPLSEAPPATILRAGLRGGFSLVFGTPTVVEILGKITTKPYLRRAHIPRTEADELLWLLHQAGEHFTCAPTAIPPITRDRKDDYLLAYSIAAQVDYLISSDHDLLELGEFGGVRIVSPAAFAMLLDHLE